MKKISLSIGTDKARNVRVRLSLMIVDDADAETIISEHYHSINFAPGDNPADIRAAVEAHLTTPAKQSGIPGAPWPAIPDDEWNEAVTIINTLHTPARKLARFTRDLTEVDNIIASTQQNIAFIETRANEVLTANKDNAKAIEKINAETVEITAQLMQSAKQFEKQRAAIVEKIANIPTD